MSMGIYIKNMKMPEEGCKDCLFVKRKGVFDICPFLKREVDGNVERGGKPLGCPLVPVPPHGRLIDADKMERDMSNTVQGDIRGYPYSDTLWDMAFRWIDHQPTIIEAEEEQE